MKAPEPTGFEGADNETLLLAIRLAQRSIKTMKARLATLEAAAKRLDFIDLRQLRMILDDERHFSAPQMVSVAFLAELVDSIDALRKALEEKACE